MIWIFNAAPTVLLMWGMTENFNRDEQDLKYLKPWSPPGVDFQLEWLKRAGHKQDACGTLNFTKV